MLYPLSFPYLHLFLCHSVPYLQTIFSLPFIDQTLFIDSAEIKGSDEWEEPKDKIKKGQEFLNGVIGISHNIFGSQGIEISS